MTTYVIESRNPDGTLELKGPQPAEYFGNKAISGITEDEIAKAIFRTVPAAVMSGMTVSIWPQNINKSWIARVKYW